MISDAPAFPSLPARPRRLAAGALGAIGCLAVVVGGHRPGVSAVPPPAPPAAFDCRWADTPITIDGKPDDSAWKAARMIDRFSLPWLGKGARAARAATRARLLWDRENLYFFAEMDDGDLYADVTEHDGKTWDNDVFELFFKPAADKPGYYEFQVNAAGTVLDMFLPQRSDGGFERFRKDGDFHLETKTALRGTLNQRRDRDNGWSVEGRIPWTDFLRTGGRPAEGERWKLALCRYDYSVDSERPELSTCAPLPRADFHRHEDYAALRFVGPEKETARPFGIDRRIPLTTSRVIGSPDPPRPYRARRAFPKLNLTYPVTVVHEPGSDRLLAIAQQWGGGPSTLLRFRDDPNVDRFETLLKVDRAAYDLTFHPDFKTNGYMYLGSKGPLSAEPASRMTGVTRYVLGRELAAESAKTIIEWPSDGHDGSALVFGLDGMLYITSGDGTSDSDVNVVGQDMSRLTAKLLRIDVDHPDAGRAYAVPGDNPFAGMKGARPETWAYGFRNPWRIALDRKTGQIWVGNNGQDLWETAYLIERGANYGWSVNEGSHPFYPNRKLGPTPASKPTIEHPHSEARSLTGGLVYYGQKYPELRGAYLYGDYSTGKIWGMRHDGKRVLWHRELADTTLQITGFGTDSRGEILIADNRGGEQGGFYTLEPTPRDARPSTFPTRLSRSGLFKTVKGHVPVPALIPYSVNAPLWSDGAYKERYIGLPAADSRIDFTTWRGWNFPDRTVLVKSFALEADEGNPASRRWIETRFLTKQEGEWVGYSYRWNDAQTDATLVEAKGADRELSVRVPRSAQYPEGIRKQVWRYPSRADCMVCHSRAANFVLGLNVLQMNRDHDYGGVKDNQLRVLERLGALRVTWAADAENLVREAARARGLTGEQAEAYVRKQVSAEGQRTAPESSLLTQAPEKYAKLVDPYDPKAAVDLRARSYLHGNCAQCHVEAGGGNAQIELEFSTPAERTRLFDVRPVHATFGLGDARLVAPGHPERSVLLHRLSHRDKGFMPPLATVIVDRQAVGLLSEWIRQMERGGDAATR
jgi:uncharacterized repeat protein (TIGR03806 family)